MVGLAQFPYYLQGNGKQSPRVEPWNQGEIPPDADNYFLYSILTLKQFISLVTYVLTRAINYTFTNFLYTQAF